MIPWAWDLFTEEEKEEYLDRQSEIWLERIRGCQDGF